jgi:hypothetical protein
VILAPKGLVGLWRAGLDRLTTRGARETELPADAKLRTDP